MLVASAVVKFGRMSVVAFPVVTPVVWMIAALFRVFHDLTVVLVGMVVAVSNVSAMKLCIVKRVGMPTAGNGPNVSVVPTTETTKFSSAAS